MIYVYYHPGYSFEVCDYPNRRQVISGRDMLGEFIEIFEDWEGLIDYIDNRSTVANYERDSYIKWIDNNKDNPILNMSVNERLFDTYNRIGFVGKTTICVINYNEFIKKDNIDQYNKRLTNNMRYHESIRNRSENIDKILNN